MVDQCLDHALPAMQHREHAGRIARLLHELAEQCGGERHLLRGLEHERIAERDGDGEKPHRYHRWKVEWGDTGHHTEWLAAHVAAHALAHFERGTRVEILQTE